MIVRIGLSLCVVALMIALVGCSPIGRTGITTIDGLTNAQPALLGVNTITGATAANGQVTITVVFSGAVDDDTVIENSTIFVETPDGDWVDGVVGTGAVADDATIVWTSNELFAAGTTFHVALIGEDDPADADGAIVGLTGLALEADGDQLEGDGIIGEDLHANVVAP